MARWTADDIPDLEGRTILVTGANSGLGLSSATALAAHGARVLMGCRNAARAHAAAAKVSVAATGPEPTVVTLDLADLDSVRRCADEVAATTDRLDVLMNNAGVMALPLRRTAQGFEAQFGTNHLGHFALTGAVLPLLLAAEAPRVVTTSSQAHRIGRMRWDDLNWERGYQRWPAYGQSKLANLLFTAELERRAGGALLAAAAHPGYAATHLQAAGPEMEGNHLMKRLNDFGNRVFAQSADMGALPQLYAATADGVRGGDYYGPGGPFEARGYPQKTGSTRAAGDEASARRLWEVSEELTGTTYRWS